MHLSPHLGFIADNIIILSIGTNSSTSVVDLNCRVWGTDNLFIVDAGIIPSQPMSNTQAAVYTAAELAVERILAFKGH